MQDLLSKLQRLVAGISLRPAIAIALVVGLSLPIAISVSRDLTERRTALLEGLAEDHARHAEVLAIAMQVPIWDVRPDRGRPLVESIMRDERVTAVSVSAPMLQDFLVAEAPERRRGQLLTEESPVLHEGERIGTVRIEMSAASLEAAVTRQWRKVLFTGLLQLILGMLIIFPLLRFKVLAPVDRLVDQSRALAAGNFDQVLEWRRADELGSLGQSFEATRQALVKLVRNLETRNRELEENEAELARRSGVLRAALENMTDGINLIDDELRLVSWNDRLSDIMGLPREMFEAGVPVADLVAYDLAKRGLNAQEQEAALAAWRATFQPGTSSKTRHRTAHGRDIDVRRQPMPGGGYVSTFTDVTEQVAAQRQADETLRLLETVMDSVPAELHLKDRELRYQMVNRQFLQTWRMRREEVIGKTNEELFPGEAQRRADARDRQVLESREALPFYEGTGPGIDGTELATWATKVPLLDAESRVSHILTVDVDITDRKRAEQETQRWLQLFEDAIESIPNGFAIFDTSKRLMLCNSANAALYGKTPDELAGTSMEELLPQLAAQLKSIDGRDASEAELPPGQMYDRLWRGRDDVPIEIELTDGRWMLLSRHPTAEGGVTTIRTDVTDLKAMENALRESESLVRSILEACPVPIGMYRAEDGLVIYESPAGQRLFGRAPDSPQPTRTVDHFVRPEDRTAYLAAISENGLVDDYEIEFQRSDASRFWGGVSARLLEFKGEAVIVSTIQDLTERRALEEERARQREALYQSEKINALGGLLAGVAHELNNPLSVVVGQALLLGETAEDPKIRKRAERIGRAAHRCSRIVKTFLAMARQSAPERMPVNLNDVVESALEITGYGLRSANIEVVCRLSEDLPPVWGDGDQLSQVLMNLVVNAEQALADQVGARKLTITTDYDPESEKVALAVLDSGPGIPPDLRSRIFEPFFTTKEFGVGTGVGLAVSVGIVQAHGGTIEAGESADGGAAFTVALPPSARSAEAADEPGEPEPAAGPACRVLVVDDEPEVTEMLAEILSLDGHEIETAGSGNAAMRILAQRSFDVILSDMRMPDVDGPGLYLRLKNAYPDMLERIVFITGDTLGPTNRSFLEQTGAPYIEKPLSPEEVRQVVRQVLSGDLAAGS